MECSICLQERPSLKFRTGRLSICAYCVKKLNETKHSPRQAMAEFSSTLRANIIHTHADAIDWVDEWLRRNASRILEERLRDPIRVKQSHALKVIRAHRRGVICLDRKYLDYPHERIWNRKRFRLKDSHGFACYSCGAHEADGAKLDPHHIIFRSNSGTNGDVNLVILCRDCHQDQHSHPLSVNGGEGEGFDIDDAPDEGEPELVDLPPTLTPPNASIQSRPQVEPHAPAPCHEMSAPIVLTATSPSLAPSRLTPEETAASPSLVWKFAIASVVAVIALKACQSVEPDPANLQAPGQTEVPVVAEKTSSREAPAAVGGRAYLKRPLAGLTSEQTQAAAAAWLETHPEVTDVAMVEALTAEFAAIIREHPLMPAGDALDLALARTVSTQSDLSQLAAPN